VFRQHLVDRPPQMHAALLRARSAEEHGRRTRVIRAGIRAFASGQRMGEVTHDVEAIAELLERLQGFSDFESGSLGGRRPLVHRRAMRHVDAAEAVLR